MIRLPFWRSRSRQRPITEEEAYHHSYGDRRLEVRTVAIEPRRPRATLRVSGDDLRRAFQERLERREQKEDQRPADG